MPNTKQDKAATSNVPVADREQFIKDNALAVDREYKRAIARLRDRVTKLEKANASLRQQLRRERAAKTA